MEPKRRSTRKRKADDVKDNDGAPPPKRAKLLRKQGRLAGLLCISIDVVFEIFSHLQPFDLLRLSRLSKEFRALLMSKSSITVWRSCIDNAGLPLPPPDTMNEPQLVRLAFDNVCQTCDAIARKVDWPLLKRLCSRCAKSKLTSIARGRYQHIEFLELILSRPDSNKPWLQVCLKEEYDDMTAKHLSLPAEDKEKFTQERTELVKTLSHYAKICKEWDEGRSEARTTELAELKEERYNAIVAKLAVLGWAAEIEGLLPSDDLRNHRLVKSPNPLTERTWKTIEPELILYMEEMKKKRLAREFAALVVTRKNAASKVLRTFKRSQLPWTEVMPGVADFHEFPPIVALLQEPAHATVDEHSFEALLPDLPTLIATWRGGIIEKLLKRHKELDPGQEAELQLAKCVFKCNECRSGGGLSLFLGLTSARMSNSGPLYWPRVLSHRCLSHLPDFLPWMLGTVKPIEWAASSLEFDRATSEIVVKIVTACGLDPEKTTVDDMDRADARLACLRCAKRKKADEEGEASTSAAAAATAVAASDGEKTPATGPAFTWRNAVLHERLAHGFSNTAWYKLNDEDASIVRGKEATKMAEEEEFEKSDSSSGTSEDNAQLQTMLDSYRAILHTRAWRRQRVKSLRRVLDRIRESNLPQEASMEEDHEACNIRPAQLPELAYSCAHCLDTVQDRAPTTLIEMLLHLTSRHDISSPNENQDYYRALAAPEIYNQEVFPSPHITTHMPPSPPPEVKRSFDFLPFGFGPGFFPDDDDDDMLMGYGGYDYSDDDDFF
ncbi:hypothetical protein C8F01DRAFT_391282 [Mycena amicta]|nr:hypothetical protein C8F01DRAFT_391282 [Mycena amicta]